MENLQVMSPTGVEDPTIQNGVENLRNMALPLANAALPTGALQPPSGLSIVAGTHSSLGGQAPSHTLAAQTHLPPSSSHSVTIFDSPVRPAGVTPDQVLGNRRGGPIYSQPPP